MIVEINEIIAEEIRLKRTILDAVVFLLSRMEFSQEEGNIELDIMKAITILQGVREVYTGWLED
jgi:hypothetical protein